MRDNFRGPALTPEEAAAQDGRELFAAIEQIECDYLDTFTIRPVTALRAIHALEPYLPREHRRAVPEPTRKPYTRVTG